MIPVHEFESSKGVKQHFDLIRLKPKKGYSENVPHRHEYYELFVFENGGGVHLIDFQEVDVTACSMHIVAPGQVHHLKRSKNSVGFALLFEEGFLQHNKENIQFISKFSYMEIESYSPVFQFDMNEFADISNLIEMIANECNNGNELNEEIIKQLLNVIILNCRRKESKGKTNRLSEGQLVYAEFRKQVDRQFRALKKVKEYADLLNTNERQLNDTSKRNSGKSASTIIFDRIIIEAKRLIVNTEMSVKEICFDLNYDDPAHFSKFFKSQSGYSPSQFRELYTK